MDVARFLKVEHVICAASICLLALAGCVSPAFMPLHGTRPLLKIGLAAPFEGLDRPLGYEALAGVKLALAERNAAGGVGGYMIELVALNDFGESDEARLQAQEFASDPAVVGVISGWSDETVRASVPVYRQAGLAVVIPWSVLPERADREAGVVLVAADVQRSAAILAQAVAAARPIQLVVVADETSRALYADEMGRLSSRAQVLPPPDVLDSHASREWAARLVLGRTQPPDVLVLATDSARAGEVLLALTAFDWTGVAFGGVETGSDHLTRIAGNAADGLTFASPAPTGQDVLQTEGNSVADWDGLGPRVVLAYDATHVLLDAIELAIGEVGYPSRRAVAAALPLVERRGLTGDITFDARGCRTDAPVWLYKIVHGEYPGQMLLAPQVTMGDLPLGA